MRNTMKVVVLSLLAVLVGADPAFAAEGGGYVGLGIGLTMGVAAIGGALGQGRIASAALDAVGRNPSAQPKMTQFFFLGLVFVETLVIFSFVIAYFLLDKI